MAWMMTYKPLSVTELCCGQSPVSKRGKNREAVVVDGDQSWDWGQETIHLFLAASQELGGPVVPVCLGLSQV